MSEVTDDLQVSVVVAVALVVDAPVAAVVVVVVVRVSVVVDFDVGVDAGTLLVALDVVVAVGDCMQVVVECLMSSRRFRS